MKFSVFCFLLLIFTKATATYSEEFTAVKISSTELSWTKVGKQVWFSPITGEESTPGMYVYRVKFEKGHKNEPHFHSDERVVTVLSGSVYVGFGAKFEESTMVKLTAGGVYTEPRNFPHYVWAKDQEVVLQVVGSGSSKRSSVNEKVH